VAWGRPSAAAHTIFTKGVTQRRPTASARPARPPAPPHGGIAADREGCLFASCCSRRLNSLVRFGLLSGFRPWPPS